MLNEKDRKIQLEEAVIAARSEIREIEHKELIEVNKSRIGKCYKFRNNYSLPSSDSDYWWLYMKILEVDDSGILAMKFQQNKYGKITIEPSHDTRLSNYGWLEISLSEFVAAWRDIIHKIDNLSPI